jgi:hypothetical protein
MHDLKARVVDTMVFLLAQNPNPTRQDWLAAIDDLFEDFSEPDKERIADAAIAMTAAERRPVLKLVA